MRTRTLIEGVNKNLDEKLTLHSQNFNHEIGKLQDVAKERHGLFEKFFISSKQSVELNLTKLRNSLDQEISKLDTFYGQVKSNVETLIGAIRTLIEDIQATKTM